MPLTTCHQLTSWFCKSISSLDFMKEHLEKMPHLCVSSVSVCSDFFVVSTLSYHSSMTSKGGNTKLATFSPKFARRANGPRLLVELGYSNKNKERYFRVKTIFILKLNWQFLDWLLTSGYPVSCLVTNQCSRLKETIKRPRPISYLLFRRAAQLCAREGG